MSMAEELAKLLAAMEHVTEDHWPVYSRQIIERMSEEVKYSGRVLDALDIHVRTGIEEFFEGLVGNAPPDITVLRHLVSTLRGLALLGRCVIVGRGGAVLTAGLPGGIHVRLIAPEPWRQKNLVSRFGWDEAKARTFLREEEDRHHSFFYKYLQQDVNDPVHYDLILNVARLSREAQLMAVAAVFKQRFPAE
jgi:cytidylate kinase